MIAKKSKQQRIFEMFDRGKSLDYVMSVANIKYSTAREYHRKWRDAVEKDAIINYLKEENRKLIEEMEQMKNDKNECTCRTSRTMVKG